MFCFFNRSRISGSLLFWQVTFVLLFVLGGAQAAQWSQTDPAINLTHVFEGEINKRGKPVGFHARPLGQDPAHARLIKRLSGPNNAGVYTGRAEIQDRRLNEWKAKSFSSFFPDRLTRAQITDYILVAFKDARPDKRGKWRGKSGAGFQIEGWLCPKGGTKTCPDGAINTAYPIYQKDR